MEKKYSDLLARYDAAMEDIRRAERDFGRDAGEVSLIPAAKYADSAELDALCSQRGLKIIGENRTDTLLEHMAGMENRVEIHFIGHLQRNKVKGIVDKVTLIHSLESLGLAEELERQAAKRDIRVRVLVEINIGREESKSGVLPEDLCDFCLALAAYPHVELCGFMTMAPKCSSEDEYYNYFKQAHDLSMDVWENALHNSVKPIFSMGMSESYRPAIAAGATIVRVGSRVFGRTTADILMMKNKTEDKYTEDF